TVGDVLDRTARHKGTNVAVVSCHQNIAKTYAEFKRDVDQLAAGFVSLKLGLQAKIALIASNMYEWAVTQFAVAKAGLVLVNINPAFQVPEIEHSLILGDCAVVIFAENFVGQDYYSMLLQMVPEINDSKPGELNIFHNIISRVTSYLATRGKRRSHLCSGSNLTRDDNRGSKRAIFYLDLTPICVKSEGTTGKPKGALLSHFNIVNNANSCGLELGLHDQKDSICLNVPLVHCVGCVVGTLTAVVFGSTVVMPAPTFDATAALEAIAKRRCTIIYGTPTMYIDIIRHQEGKHHDLSSLRKGIMAGALCPPEILKNAMAKLNIQRLHIFYGTTECSPVITCSRPEEPINKWIQTVGRPLGHVEVKIVNNDNRIVPLKSKGELCTRGYLVFLGYYKNEAKTKEVVESGWFYTGQVSSDEAIMSDGGIITITGRIRDMICRGGENVYPLEIENCLHEHPDVEEVQVVGVPDPRYGEEACAWIKLKPGKTTTTEENIREFCLGKVENLRSTSYKHYL
ncbi:unnamed protein product, partial [Ixodes hexagonus]